jgi:hypothetical protein
LKHEYNENEAQWQSLRHEEHMQSQKKIAFSKTNKHIIASTGKLLIEIWIYLETALNFQKN